MRPPVLHSTPRYIAWHARHAPGEPAIIKGRHVISYAGFAADLVRCVRALGLLDIAPRMLIGIEHADQYAHLILLLACEAIGAATVSLTRNEATRADHLRRYCDLILSNEPNARPRTRKISAGWLSAVPAPVAEGDLTLLERDVTAELPARIITSSGTTGPPKAIMLDRATMGLRLTRANERLPAEMPAKPRLLFAYQLVLGGICMRVLSTLRLGGAIVFAGQRDIWDLIGEGAVDHVLITAGELERAIEHARRPPDGHVLHVGVFGAALPARLRAQVRERLDASMACPYATTETETIALMDGDGTGSLCPGVEIRVVDEAGIAVDRGESGTICVRSDTMAKGYFKDPERTAASFVDGWYRTGDLGFEPEPGRLAVLGRADDLLNIGGLKIAPAPIEAALKRIAGVSDAAVLSIATPGMVDRLLAAVEIGADGPPPEIAEQIRRVVPAHVGAFDIMWLVSFPRTESNKVRRHDIAGLFRRHQLAGATL
jgi:acyl-coenzyme A synthetase/AMP-(fatty) acid ligase